MASPAALAVALVAALASRLHSHLLHLRRRLAHLALVPHGYSPFF